MDTDNGQLFMTRKLGPYDGQYDPHGVGFMTTMTTASTT
jgi:hypothetical protein